MLQKEQRPSTESTAIEKRCCTRCQARTLVLVDLILKPVLIEEISIFFPFFPPSFLLSRKTGNKRDFYPNIRILLAQHSSLWRKKNKNIRNNVFFFNPRMYMGRTLSSITTAPIKMGKTRRHAALRILQARCSMYVPPPVFKLNLLECTGAFDDKIVGSSCRDWGDNLAVPKRGHVKYCGAPRTATTTTKIARKRQFYSCVSLFSQGGTPLQNPMSYVALKRPCTTLTSQ